MSHALSLRRAPFFYGWFIVAVAVIGQFISAGTQAYAIGAFLKPMTADLGWSRESFSLVQTIGVGVGGVVGLFIGGFIDRRGPRLLMFIGGILTGATVMLTSQVTELWQFYLVRGVGQALGLALVGNLVVNVTVAKWFVVRRGMAVAIASIGISLGGVIMTPLVTWWVETYDWQTAWILLGILIWVLSLPSALIMRRSPEDMGLLPDGMSAEEAVAYSAKTKRASATSEVQWTRAQAVRTKALWLIIVGYGSATLGLGALLFHMLSFLTDAGFTSGKAAFLFAVFSWAALLCKFVWGPLMDRFHARSLSALGFGISAISIAALVGAGRAESEPLMVMALIVYGFGIGGIAPLQETVWASYFGRAHLGEIRAVAMPFTIVFSAGGPFLGGALFDRTGTYDTAFFIFAAFSGLAFLMLLIARAPSLPPSEPVAPGSA
ncbi:MAG: MFS transporter [Tepidiformaceae bacterium]